jgi:multidrug efflux pump
MKARVGSKEIGFAVVDDHHAGRVHAAILRAGQHGQAHDRVCADRSHPCDLGFIALSLVPMCSRLLKHDHSWVYRKTEPFFQGMTDGYRAAVRAVLTTPLFRVPWPRRRVLRFDVRIFVLGVFLLFVGAGVWLFLQLKGELSPEEDRSLFLAFVIAPEGSSMQYTDSYMRAVEEITKGVPEIDTMFAVVAPGLERPNPVNLGIAFAVLKPWSQRTRSQQQITKELGPKLYGGLPGALSFVKGLPPLGQPLFSKAVEYVIYGNTYEELQTNVNKMMAKLSTYPGITGLDTDLKLNKPQLAVKIDRDKAAALGSP